MTDLTIEHQDGGRLLVEGALVIEEARTYVLKHPTATGIWLSERALRRTEEGWVLPIDSWAGTATLRVCVGAAEERIPVDVLPRSEKLDAVAWQSMLQDLELWSHGVTAGLAGGRHGGVKVGLPLPVLTEALLPLMASFSRNLIAIDRNPRLRSLERVEHVPFHRVRSITGDLIVWLAANPAGAQYINPEARAEDMIAAPPLVPQGNAYASLDHPANRFVAWLCRRVVERLEACGQIWDGHSRGDTEHTEWASQRAVDCRVAATSLRRTMRQTFLQSVEPSPATEEAHLVIADDPAYARFYRLARLMLSPNFDPTAEASAVPVRETYSLYELWCFLQVQRQLATALPGASWQAKKLEAMLDPSGTGAGAYYVAALRDGRQVLVEFNPTFRSVWARGSSTRWSLSKERRPDIVVSVRGESLRPRWLFLDAKYRVRRDNLGEAFESVHIYRDSLRDDERGGRCVAGALLAPRQLTEAAHWFSQEFRVAHDCGIFAVTPGPVSGDVATWILEKLGL